MQLVRIKQLKLSLIIVFLFLAVVVIASATVAKRNSKPVFDNISKISPFIDVVDKDSRTLLREINDIIPLLDADAPDLPRINIAEYPLYDVELFASAPYRYIVWAGYHFYKENGVRSTTRDSHHQLLASPYVMPPNPDIVYRDLYKNVLQKRGFDSFSVFLGVARAQEINKEQFLAELGLKRVNVYGSKTERRRLPDPISANVKIKRTIFTVGEKTKGDEYRINFPLANKLPDATARGVNFDISEVQAVFLVNQDHAVRQLSPGEKRLIGSMSVQTFAILTHSNEYQVFYFNSVDSIELDFSGANLKVVLYDYDVRERTTRGSQRIPDANGLRVHPNLGVTDKLPDDFITMRIVASNSIVFPLWQPKGFLSALSITEHADYNGIEQDNLTMYGNLDGVYEPDSGLMGHGIPVTKTVFPKGTPSQLPIINADTGESVQIHQSNVEDHADYRQQLSRYSQYADVEIGLHCAGNARSKTTDSLVKILADMKERYNSVTWVDHGGVECLWETGWDPESESYLLPALKQNEFKYLNARDDKFNSAISLILDDEPGNTLFYVPRFDDDLTDKWKAYHFATTSLVFSEELFSKQHLAKIVSNRGLQNMHAYLPLQVLTVENKRLVKAAWYEEALDNLAYYRDKGDIYLATTRDLLDFILFVRDIDYVGADNTIKIFSPEKEMLQSQQPTFGVVSLTEERPQDVRILPEVMLSERLDKNIAYIYPANRN